MEILVHTKHVKADEEHIRSEILRVVERFAARLTRVDAYVRDVNGAKGGVDMRCVLEARPRGLDPVSAEHEAETPQDAVAAAAGKLERILETRFGRLDERR